MSDLTRGGYIVTEADVKRHFAEIETILPAVRGRIVQIYRDNETVTGDCHVETLGKSLIIKSGKSNYALTEGDLIYFVCW